MPSPLSLHPGDASPLAAAVLSRDSDTLDMVRVAIQTRNVRLAYQPIMHAQTQSDPCFFEGLIRVLDKTGRVISARDFMDALEHDELGRKMDCLALEIGLRQLSQRPGMRTAINMSARSIGYSPWMRTLKNGLKRDPNLGKRLILEITETTAIMVPEIVKAFMDDLQNRGITFALDDFGAGYSSLRYLQSLYFDLMKIDGQFIRKIHIDPDKQAIVRSMVSLAQHFQMFTVAESVETQADANWLVAAGVDCLQGYLFGAPKVDLNDKTGDTQARPN